MKKDFHDEIAKVAHDLHEKSGWIPGNDLQNWLEAERIVLVRYEMGTEKEKSKKSSKATIKKRK